MRSIEWTNNHIDMWILLATCNQMRWVHRLQYIVTSIVWTSNVKSLVVRLLLDFLFVLFGIHDCVVQNKCGNDDNFRFFLSPVSQFSVEKQKLAINSVLDERNATLNERLLDSQYANYVNDISKFPIDCFLCPSETVLKQK